jgi:hypothetical protein
MVMRVNENSRVRAAVAILALAFVTPASADLIEKGKQLLQGGGAKTALSNAEIGSGLKEALRIGTENVVNRLGTSGGFANDPAVHIPLPKSLKKVKSVLDTVGKGKMMDNLELKMNQAAESATPQAKQLFVDAIGQMTIEDVKGIYNGPPDAATRYFQSKMSAPLAEKMTPIVETQLAEVGAVKTLDKAMARYKDIPMVPDVKTNLTQHVVKKGVDGIFHYLAQEEAAIRTQPVKRTTDLLKKVFGG